MQKCIEEAFPNPTVPRNETENRLANPVKEFWQGGFLFYN